MDDWMEHIGDTENEQSSTIVQNITYNIHDSAIGGDVGSDLNE
jgi:hypothetical protein